jgi:hypothetical protein
MNGAFTFASLSRAQAQKTHKNKKTQTAHVANIKKNYFVSVDVFWC